MRLIDGEETVWEDAKNGLLLTTHRLRSMNKSIWGSRIQSIMLESLSYSELRTIKNYGFLRRAVVWMLLLNGSVYLLNNYLFEAELIKFFFDDLHIGAGRATAIFYISVAIAILCIVLFFFSVKKVFSFFSGPHVIDFQLKWLDYEERENFISLVESTRDARLKSLSS